MNNFDPTYNYTLDDLLRVGIPPEPTDFAEFWRARYQRALELHHPLPKMSYSGSVPDFEIYDLRYRSTGDFSIGGWVLIPKRTPVTRGMVVGHGYGGREEPDLHLPISSAAFLFPCFRGMSRSKRWPISDNPIYHVLHDIDKRDHYILGGCVEDLWLGVSTLLVLFPWLAGHVGYLGISFGGGIGALALPWDTRIQRAHFNVPSFGHHPLRLQLPTWGSAASVQKFQREHGNVLATLSYYDAAIAARYVAQPVHVAAALADPVVAPPGQFAIYNALRGEKQLFVLEQGHADYPRRTEQEQALLEELNGFFTEL